MTINKKSIAKSSQKLPPKIRTIVRNAAGIKTTKRVAKKKQQQPTSEKAMIAVLIIVVLLCTYHILKNMQ